MARGTLLDKSRSPLRHSLVVLAHHAFAGTRHVGSHDVESLMQLPETGGVAVGDHTVRITPFHNVLAQNLRAPAVNFVCHDERAVGQSIDGSGGFSSRSGTQVEVSHRRIASHLTQHMANKHRRCVLHIVAPGMQQRIERELSPRVEVDSRPAPSHGVVGRRRHSLAPVNPHRHRRFGLQSLKQSVGLLWQQRQHLLSEKYR